MQPADSVLAKELIQALSNTPRLLGVFCTMLEIEINARRQPAHG